MKKVQISQIPELIKKFDNSLRLMHDSDIRLDVENYDYWSRDSEIQYNKITEKLDKIKAKGKGYIIYVWYDISGFDYWINTMKEDNYAQITVQFDSESINYSQLRALERRINKIMVKVNNVIFY